MEKIEKQLKRIADSLELLLAVYAEGLADEEEYPANMSLSDIPQDLSEG